MNIIRISVKFHHLVMLFDGFKQILVTILVSLLLLLVGSLHFCRH